MRILLYLVVMALAVSPLRGVFALPVAGAAEDGTHCAAMAHGMHTPGHAHAGMHDGTKADPHHHCKQGCGGNCCDGGCGNCVHACLALPRAPVTGSGTYHEYLAIAVVQRCAGRTIPPPFRPPIVLPS